MLQTVHFLPAWVIAVRWKTLERFQFLVMDLCLITEAGWALYHKTPVLIQHPDTLLVINGHQSGHWMDHKLNHSWDLAAEELEWLMNTTPGSRMFNLVSGLADKTFSFNPTQTAWVWGTIPYSSLTGKNLLVCYICGCLMNSEIEVERV